MDTLETIRDVNIRRFLKVYEPSDDFMDYLIKIHYFTAPSSMKKHGAWIGGNFDHSMRVFELLTQYTKENGLKWDNPRSPAVVALFHDICKSNIRDFVMTDDGYVITKNEYCDLRHAEKSLDMLRPYIDLTLEERFCIYYHMGGYDENDEYNELMNRIIDQYPNVLWTQKADTLAASEGI